MLEMEIIKPNILEMELSGQVPSTIGGTTNYNELSGKPKINGVELIGNKTTKDLGIEAGKEVHIGTDEPTGEELIWIDPSEEADVIPTKTSELENDSGFITEIPNEYAKKTDIPSIDGLATEDYVTTAIQNALEVVENGTY